MQKKLMTSLKISLVILLVLTLALPAWAGRGHRHRPHYSPSYHQSHRGHVQLHAVGAGIIGLGLITGAAIAATAFAQPRVVVREPAPTYCEKWPHRSPGYRPYHELGAAQVTAQLLNVRQNPGRYAPIVMQVPQGTYLSVRATTDGWLFVSLGGDREGWVMKQYTTWGVPHPNG
jgi:hypothetical protein